MEEDHGLLGVKGAVSRRQGRGAHTSQLHSGDAGGEPECLHGVAA